MGLLNEKFYKLRQARSKAGSGRKPAEGPCQALKVTVKDTNPTGTNSNALSVTSRQEFLQARVQGMEQ